MIVTNFINAHFISTGPPIITSKSPANITADVETDVTLVCEVISDPRALIVWQYIDMQGNVVEIKRTSDGLDGYYVISNARLKDSGKYVCNVSNTYGYDSYVTDVLIKPSKLE